MSRNRNDMREFLQGLLCKGPSLEPCSESKPEQRQRSGAQRCERLCEIEEGAAFEGLDYAFWLPSYPLLLMLVS